MTTGYAVFGDLDSDADSGSLKDMVTENIFGPTPEITDITWFSAPDRQMALLEFTVDDDADLDDLMTGSDELIELTNDKQQAEKFLTLLEDYPREPLGALLIRGLSPRPMTFPV